MKELLKNKKFLIISTIVAVVIVIFAALVIAKNAQENRIAEYISGIEAQYVEFQESEDRDEQIEILTTTINDYETYQEGEKKDEAVTEEYEETISKMKEELILYYDDTITANTIADLDKINDKNQIVTAKTNLTNLLTTIESEKELLLNEEQYNEYATTINETIASYDSRVAAIEKAEKEEAERIAAEQAAAEEAARKAEEEAAAKEEENNNSNSGGSNNSGGGGGSSGGEDDEPSNGAPSNDPNWSVVGGRWCYGPWTSTTNNGTGLVTYHDTYGNHWNVDGDHWTDYDLGFASEPPWYYPEPA